jgi:hypothetical protein
LSALPGEAIVMMISKYLLALGLLVSTTVAVVAVGPQTPSVTNPALTGEAPLPRAGEKDADGRTVYRARVTGHLTNYYEDAGIITAKAIRLRSRTGRRFSSFSTSTSRHPESTKRRGLSLLQMFREELSAQFIGCAVAESVTSAFDCVERDRHSCLF